MLREEGEGVGFWRSAVDIPREVQTSDTGETSSTSTTRFVDVTQPKKGWVRTGFKQVWPILDILNTEPDLGSGSAISLNLDPNLGPVQTGSSSNRSSEPNHGITK